MSLWFCPVQPMKTISSASAQVLCPEGRGVNSPFALEFLVDWHATQGTVWTRSMHTEGGIHLQAGRSTAAGTPGPGDGRRAMGSESRPEAMHFAGRCWAPEGSQLTGQKRKETCRGWRMKPVLSCGLWEGCRGPGADGGRETGSSTRPDGGEKKRFLFSFSFSWVLTGRALAGWPGRLLSSVRGRCRTVCMGAELGT